MNFIKENIPQELRQRLQWIPVAGKKPLLKDWPTPAQQMPFEAAVAKSQPFPGLVLHNNLFCLDCDKVLKDGRPSTGFVEIMKQVKEKAGSTYTEKSQSCKGLHMFFTANIPTDSPDTLKFPLEGGGVLELYTGTGKGRFIAVTGHKVGKADTVADGQAVLDFLIKKAARKKQKNENVGGADERPCYLSVDEIPVIIRKSASGELFKRLYDDGEISDYNNDHSAADIALMNLLPFYCAGRAEIMEQVFSNSALGQREKWQRDDYRNRTIQKALSDWNGECYTPEYGKTSPDEDFNDLDKDPDIISRPAWPVMEKTDKGSRPIKQVYENTDYLLKVLSITCRYNMLTKEVEFTGHELEGLSLEAAATVVRGIMYKNGLKVSRADLLDNIGTIAEKNRYSPVRDYLNACQVLWDGQDHIKAFFQHLHIDPAFKENTDFYEMLFRRWLIGAARIAFNDGNEAMQGLIVLQGSQGIGKTRLLYNLLPNPAWGADGISLDPGIKDDVLKVTRLFIVELGEIADTLRKEKVDRLKAFVTQRADDLRRPYRRTVEQIPRTTAFIGTVNGSGFLKDSTGERRFWVIPVEAIDEFANYDPSQLWGQVMYLAFEKKERHWLTAEEIEQLNTVNEAFKKVTDEEQALLDLLDWNAPADKWTARTPTEISYEIGLHGGRLRMIGRAVNNIARRDDRVKIPTNHVDGRKYTLPPIMDDPIGE
ncbi:MAG: hypothetical protein E7203_07315 [Selenomonas ruminantium]|jgi:hypothetical protein|uniref:Virulence-associated protein E n=1 Tax=Selenomonas ruminantium TaxID=971 RepID=A0A927ZP61_SELRU|nr:VapE domain-containing protein [Selenomonas ruminantium]MBE6085257.1 hypothetical protein [Selenomonas ruminantium]